MAQIRAFKAIRPTPEMAHKVAALPYDVYSSDEARKIVEENPLSFLKIDRAETQFPVGADMYSKMVYEKAALALKEMKSLGAFVQDETECFYIYELIMDGRSQRGLVCCASIDDYLSGVIRRHENTRVDKEIDRIRHVDICSAHTGPIFIAYRSDETMQHVIEKIVQTGPLYDFVSEDEIRHRVWKIDDDSIISLILEAFEKMSHLYIADGHHRAASAVKVGLKRRCEQADYDGTEEYNYFLSVLFDESELKIFDYNRVVHNIDENISVNLVKRLGAKFKITEYGNEIVRPSKKGEFGMYIRGHWYLLKVQQDIQNSDVVEGLDVSILQNHILSPIFGITEPKTDPNIQFVGGIRGLEALMKIVDQEEHAVAFTLYPTSMEELLAVADEGRLMPPKSTWFEPKLRSGLFIHEF